MDDIIETTEQFNAGCIVGTDFPASWKPPESSPMHTRSLCNKETSWHVWYDSDIWTLSGFELQDLGAGRSRNAHMSLRNRQCAILSLRYLDDTQMRVMVMKISREQLRRSTPCSSILSSARKSWKLYLSSSTVHPQVRLWLWEIWAWG